MTSFPSFNETHFDSQPFLAEPFLQVKNKQFYKHACISTTDRETSTRDPETNTTDPETSTTDPETSTTNPETSTTNPETSTTDPETSTIEPDNHCKKGFHVISTVPGDLYTAFHTNFLAITKIAISRQ
jgi:hypothetical protein